MIDRNCIQDTEHAWRPYLGLGQGLLKACSSLLMVYWRLIYVHASLIRVYWRSVESLLIRFTSNGRWGWWIGSLLVWLGLEMVPGQFFWDPRGTLFEKVAEAHSLPTKSSFRDTFMRGEVAEVRSLPTKTSLRELAHLFNSPLFLHHFLLFGADGSYTNSLKLIVYGRFIYGCTSSVRVHRRFIEGSLRLIESSLGAHLHLLMISQGLMRG